MPPPLQIRYVSAPSFHFHYALTSSGSYPFQDDDPFVLKDCPHVYFAGNQPEFGTRLIGGAEGQTVRLISVPSFAEKKEIVILDTETLEVNRVQIRAD